MFFFEKSAPSQKFIGRRVAYSDKNEDINFSVERFSKNIFEKTTTLKFDFFEKNTQRLKNNLP